MICDCHLPLSSDVTDISSHITKLLKFIVLSQTNSSWRLECILGPILFSIYINDLPSIPQHSFHQCYVEDTKLILNFKLQDHVNAIVKLKADFSRISNWTMRNQLPLDRNTLTIIINALVFNKLYFMFGAKTLNTTWKGSKLCKILCPVSLAT